MKRGKILQVCAIDESIDILLKPLIIESMQQGYIVHSACSDTGRFEQLKTEGLTMKEVNIERKISPFSNIKSVIELYKLIRKEQYDIVHVHTPIAALIGRVAAKLAGTRTVIYTAHGFYFHEGMAKRQFDFFVSIEKYAAKFLTDWLLLQSKEDHDFAIEHKFKTEKRTIHLSNGVDIWNKFNLKAVDKTEIEIFKEKNNISKDDFVFSFIGRLVKEKGIFELIEAFKKISEKYPKTKLLIIGAVLESDRDHESYEQLLSDFELPNIHYLGFRKDTPLLLASSDVYVLPSHREGLPRSIIEAMALGKPIIATDIRGCREEVFNDENGILVEKGNVEELVYAMAYLVENPQTSKKFGIRSREIVEEMFDEKKVLMRQINLFNSVMEASNKKGIKNQVIEPKKLKKGWYG